MAVGGLEGDPGQPGTGQPSLESFVPHPHGPEAQASGPVSQQGGLCEALRGQQAASSEPGDRALKAKTHHTPTEHPPGVLSNRSTPSLCENGPRRGVSGFQTSSRPAALTSRVGGHGSAGCMWFGSRFGPVLGDVECLAQLFLLVGQMAIEFGQTLLVVGCGTVGLCTLQLLEREFKLKRLLVLDRKAAPKGLPENAEYVHVELTKSNYRQVLASYLLPGDLCCNLSVLDSTELLCWCLEHDIMYLDTSVEEWASHEEVTLEQRTDLAAMALSAHHQRAREQLHALYARHAKERWPSCVCYHGMNPGLVNQFMKQGLHDIAATLLKRETCQNRAAIQEHFESRDWPRLAQALGVKVIHISERDTQASTYCRKPMEFVSTWSVDGFLSELQWYSEFRFGHTRAPNPTGSPCFPRGPRMFPSPLGSRQRIRGACLGCLVAACVASCLLMMKL